MLHLAGMQVRDIYEDLPDPGTLNADMYFVNLRRQKWSSLTSLCFVYVNKLVIEFWRGFGGKFAGAIN